MKKLAFVIAVLAVLPCISMAGPVANFDTIDFDSYQLLYSINSTADNPNLTGLGLTSSVYGNGSEYIYAYQLFNNSSVTVENFVLPDFVGAVAGSLGYTLTDLPFEFDSNIGAIPVNGEITSGNDVQFDYDAAVALSELAPGTISAVMVVKTTAGFDFSQASVQGSQNGLMNTITPVPEPASMALLGLGSLVLARRRKK